MKNVERWIPTKYEERGGQWRASRNARHLSISSRLMADITTGFYQTFLKKFAKGNLADLGCGNVPFYGIYKDVVNTVTCVDWPNTLHKNEYLDFECDLNQTLPLSDSNFDTIIISEVLEHISSPEETWKEMTRILKPGGHIILSVPFLYKIHEAPHDYFRYTEFALKNFAKKNNLDIVELKAFGGLPEVLTDILAKKLIQLPLLGKVFSIWIQSLCLFFVRTKVGRKISMNTAVAYPLGYFMVITKK